MPTTSFYNLETTNFKLIRVTSTLVNGLYVN